MDQEETGGGRRLPLTVFAMHVFAGGGWGGSGGKEGGLRSRTVGLSLTVSQGNYTPAT